MDTVTTPHRKAVLERLALAETVYQRWHLTVLSGDTIDDVLSEGYLTPLSRRLRRHDRITITDDSDSFFAELLVLESSSDRVRVVALRGGPLPVGGQAIGAPGSTRRRDPELRVEYRGPFLQWCCVRGDQILKDKCATEAIAAQWLAQYSKTVSET